MVTISHEAGSMRDGGRSGRLASAAAVVGGLLAGLLTGTPQAWAQWTTNGANISYTNGDVGVGTTSPLSMFHVAGVDAVMRFEDTATSRTWVFQSTANRFNVRDLTAGAVRTTVDSSGNLGIGTMSPAAKLHVAGDAQVDGNIAAKYQDVAEWVRARDAIPAGTVVVLDREQVNSVQASSAAYDTGLAGVVSAEPGRPWTFGLARPYSPHFGPSQPYTERAGDQMTRRAVHQDAVRF